MTKEELLKEIKDFPDDARIILEYGEEGCLEELAEIRHLRMRADEFPFKIYKPDRVTIYLVGDSATEFEEK